MHKRIFTFLLCIFFLFGTANVSSLADEAVRAESLFVSGPDILLKPMDGSFSKVKFNLEDDSSDVISGAVWSSGSENLFFTDDGCAVLHKDIPTGDYTVNALYDGITYTKNIKIYDGMFRDYDEGKDGDYFLTGSRSATYHDKGNGDMYVQPDNAFYYIPGIQSVIKNVVDDVTLEYDIFTTAWKWRGAIGHVQTSCGEWAGNLEFKIDNHKYVFQIMDYTNYFENGNAGEYRSYESDIKGESWVNIKMKMKSQGRDDDGKLKDHKWDIYANDELIFSDVMFRCIGFVRGDGSKIEDCTGISNLYANVANDNTAIYSGDKFNPDDDPYIGAAINGEKTLGKPRTDTDVTSVYTFKNFLGKNLSCDWSISPSDSGVSIDSDGTVSVTKNAQPGSYEITASYPDGKKTFNIEIRDVGYKMSVSGTDKISIDSGFTEKTFEYIAADQFGTEEECDWFVSGDNDYVTISDGVLTVMTGAADGVYTVTAVPKDKTSVLKPASIDVTISTVTYSLYGTEKVIRPAAQMASAVKYTLKDSFGEEVTDGITWSCSGAEILSDGRVIVLPSTENYKVSAMYGEKTYTLNAKVSEGKAYDYESYNEGDFVSKDYGEIVKSDTKKNKSKYLYIPYTDSSHRMYVDFGLNGGGEDLVLSYDCFANPGEKFTSSPVISNIQWLESIGYGCEFKDSKYVYTFTCEDYGAEPDEGDVSVTRPTYTHRLDENDFVHVEIVFNTLANTFDMYTDGVKAFENIHLRYWNKKSFGTTATLIVGRFDNFASHSGREYDRKITYLGSNSMAVVSEGESRKLLKYSITDEDIANTGLSAVWDVVGFGDDFVGNKDDIKSEGNELVSLSPAYGTVYIKGSTSDGAANTGIIPIKLSGAFSSLSDMKIIANGEEEEEFTVNVHYPVSGNYVTSAIQYSESPSETKKIRAASDKKAVFEIDASKTGLNYITITDKNGAVEDYIVPIGCDKLFDRGDVKTLLTDEKINDYFAAYVKKNASTVKKCNALYAAMDDDTKDTVLKYTNGNADNYFASVLLLSLLSGNKSDADMCASELEGAGFKSNDINLMISGDNYADIVEKVRQNSDSLKSASENIHVYTILIGVEKYTVSYKEVKSYLEALGCSRYDSASVGDKNTIAQAVAGKKYNSLTELERAINSVDLGGSGGSGGGGKVGSGSSGKTTSGGIMGNVTPETDNNEEKNTFDDVKKSHWAYEYIENLASKNIINGYNNYFYPDNNVTRAEFVKILCTAFGTEKSDENIFADVGKNDWFRPYVCGAAKAGLVLGSDGRFNPNDAITREDACVMLYRFAKYSGKEFSSAEPISFNDESDISSYASEAVSALSSGGIVNGVGGNLFAPKANTTRAAATKIIYMIIGKGGMAQ